MPLSSRPSGDARLRTDNRLRLTVAAGARHQQTCNDAFLRDMKCLDQIRLIDAASCGVSPKDTLHLPGDLVRSCRGQFELSQLDKVPLLFVLPPCSHCLSTATKPFIAACHLKLQSMYCNACLR